MTTLMKGGTVVNHDHAVRADVLIMDEKVLAIGHGLALPEGTQVVDVGGCYLLPGGIDPHTHLEFPFMDEVSVDDFEWGTKAALAGGTTSLIDFCVPRPGQSLLEALEDWRGKSRSAACDYGFHMAVTWWDRQVADEMGECVARHGINSFKHFMAYKGALMVNDEEMIQSFTRCGQLGALPMVHAENGDVVEHLQRQLFEAGNTGPEAHGYSRPPHVEGEATTRAIMIAAMTGTPLYVVHTSCRESHEAIAAARARGQRVYGEPLIQHLVLDAGEYQSTDWDHAAERVMSPPFRDKGHQDSLWAGLVGGSLQVVATDHCAFSRRQKRLGTDDFRRIPNGTGGLEDRMRVLWTAGVNSGRLTPEEFVAATSTNAARIFNMYPRKGAIRPGSDADIVVWDPGATTIIRAEGQVSRTEYNVFEGFACRGLPVMTFLRGTLANGAEGLLAEPGQGRYVARDPHPATTVANRIRFEATRPTPVGRRLELVP
ncbi:dihydropyrimidinase [Methylobacterium sp. NEAU 140]|uniref:dihydropyrimidinase n=1 Tax=Methylobacterium sp. NEAU 140 TaxID=3064945 RepID=UPI002735A014|nr:dihydropyrimidinase [Methylobacterium sp. NEAU 140]MDP4022002.1 dihydropyrimidinase [Methylobacterium sp. NEAU 140]